MLRAIGAAFRALIGCTSTTHQPSPNNPLVAFSDEKRDRVRAWLKDVGPVAAELFDSLLALVYGPVLPGKAKLIAHCIRELRSVLIRHFVALDASGGQLEYRKELDVIAAEWQQTELVLAEQLNTTAATPAETPEPAQLLVPVAIVKSVGTLVEKHRKVTLNNRDKAARLFSTLQLGSEADGQLFQKRTEDWRELVDWFVQRVHAGKRTDGDLLTDEFYRNTGLFLESMHTFATSRAYFSGLEEVDAILEQANRPAS
jgi:hypothetical protein